MMNNENQQKSSPANNAEVLMTLFLLVGKGIEGLWFFLLPTARAVGKAIDFAVLTIVVHLLIGGSLTVSSVFVFHFFNGTPEVPLDGANRSIETIRERLSK